MNGLYQSSLYRKFHWYIADILVLVIVCAGVAAEGIEMFVIPVVILFLGMGIKRI